MCFFFFCNLWYKTTPLRLYAINLALTLNLTIAIVLVFSSSIFQKWQNLSTPFFLFFFWNAFGDDRSHLRAVLPTILQKNKNFLNFKRQWTLQWTRRHLSAPNIAIYFHKDGNHLTLELATISQWINSCSS